MCSCWALCVFSNLGNPIVTGTFISCAALIGAWYLFFVFTPANTHFAVVERSGLQTEAVAEAPDHVIAMCNSYLCTSLRFYTFFRVPMNFQGPEA